MTILSILFGLLVGLSLGLTGGGGAIFAVPLLVYGIGISAREAVGISLAAVGATSFVGFLHRWKRGEIEIRTGLLFALAGMVGAPLGIWLAGFVPDTLLLMLFAGLMMIVALRLWQQASRSAAMTTAAPCQDSDSSDQRTCQRDATGTLVLNSRCALLLLLVGILTGVLSGLFGVGGGFVIVPALVLFSGMSIHRAVGTSLMVIALVSLSGVASQIAAGRSLPLNVTSLFVAGGIGGLFIGQRISQKLSGPILQKVFVVAIVCVAAFVVVRNLMN